MKKLSAIITAAVLAVSSFAVMGVSASACGKHRANTWNTQTSAGNYGANTSAAAVNTRSGTLHFFLDGNGDGLCDGCLSGVCMSNGLCSGYYHEHGYFIDNNNDGICDNFAAGVCTRHYSDHHISNNFVDINGDGICDNCAAGVCSELGHHYRYGSFIDVNGDGICDNCAAGVCSELGHHYGYGNFIDVNGDGICDNCAFGICSQHGTGIGHHQSGHGCHS